MEREILEAMNIERLPKPYSLNGRYLMVDKTHVGYFYRYEGEIILVTREFNLPTEMTSPFRVFYIKISLEHMAQPKSVLNTLRVAGAPIPEVLRNVVDGEYPDMWLPLASGEDAEIPAYYNYICQNVMTKAAEQMKFKGRVMVCDTHSNKGNTLVTLVVEDKGDVAQILLQQEAEVKSYEIQRDVL